MGPDHVRPTVRTEFIAQVSLSLANETSQREERPWSPACLESLQSLTDSMHYETTKPIDPELLLWGMPSS